MSQRRKFCIYNQYGEILETRTFENYEGFEKDVTAAAGANRWIEVKEDSLARKWVDPQTTELRDKEDFDLVINKTTVFADGEDALQISNIPPGTRVDIFGPVVTRFVVEDGEIEITFDSFGIYTFRFDHGTKYQKRVNVYAS